MCVLQQYSVFTCVAEKDIQDEIWFRGISVRVVSQQTLHNRHSVYLNFPFPPRFCLDASVYIRCKFHDAQRTARIILFLRFMHSDCSSSYIICLNLEGI